MDRIKDTMFHPINEIKARKRKESPAVIDLTEPTLKRPRSASGNDIVVVGEATETSHSRSINVERHQGRPASVEPDDEQPPTRGDVTRRMLNWSRLSVNRIGSASSNARAKSAIYLVCREKDKYWILHFSLKDPLAGAGYLFRPGGRLGAIPTITPHFPHQFLVSWRWSLG